MVDMQTEIRKLSSADIYGLVKILNDSNSWIELIQIIPNGDGQLYKYNTDHVRLIQNEATSKRSCSEILLDEWGTSGRNRPTVGFLLDLLIKANLFRAADYILVDILKGDPAPRPLEGPAAKIDTSVNLVSSFTTIQENRDVTDKDCTKKILAYSYEQPVDSSATQMGCLPDFDILLSTSHKLSQVSKDDESNITNSVISSYTPSSGYIPDLAALDIIPRSTRINSENISSGHMFSNNFENINHNTESSQYSDDSFRLPNLSELNIDRSLPQNSESSFMSNTNTNIICYPYHLLEKHTNNFNDISYGVCDGNRLGSGAFGTIYLAEGITTEPLAVKKLHKIDDYNIGLFRNEIELMSKLNHNNLLKLLGYSIDGPIYCLVYEYMSGGSLQDRLKMDNNELSPDDRINIAIGCAEGINYLHNIPVIHRDVKSANILLNQRNQPKLSDFGLVKKTSNCSSSMLATTILGTSAYMSPEAHRGDISEKMDCYSFGVVLLELITGLPPLDENREGCDLVTHVEQHCDNGFEGIDKLMDKRPGPWIQTARNLYKIALSCLQEKKNRPLIINILENLKGVRI